MPMNPIHYPHMIDRRPMADAGITILSVGPRSVRVATAADRKTTDISWSELRAAATQPDQSLAAVYAALHVSAADRLTKMPRTEQGLRVSVYSLTGGATYNVAVIDAAGRHRRDLMCADEGGSHPHEHLAHQEAAVIRSRLGC